MYTDVNESLAEPIMIFSRLVAPIGTRPHSKTNSVLLISSKHGGMAGTRFGWGFYEDFTLAQRVNNVIETLVLGISIDTELRVLASLQAILGKEVILSFNQICPLIHNIFCVQKRNLVHLECSLSMKLVVLPCCLTSHSSLRP